MRKLLIAALWCFYAHHLFGQSANTTITGTYRSASGPNPNGTLTISWSRFQNDAVPKQTVYPGRIVVNVTNGVIMTGSTPGVSLFPNAAASPTGTCYVVAAVLAGVPSTRYWTVPISPTPVDVGVVESSIPCSPGVSTLISPSQIANAGATLGQVLAWNGYYWSPANGGGGGSGITQLTTDVLAGPGTGSVAAKVVGIENGAIPISAPFLATNALGQLVATTVGTSCAVGTGSAQTQIANLSPPITTLSQFTSVCWLPVAANTGPIPTLTVNGFTANITKYGSNALANGDIATTSIASVIYDGTEWQLQNPQTTFSNTQITYNGQTVTLGSAGNVNVGSAAHSVALNEGNGVAITGATIGTAGRLLIDQGPGADPSFNVVSGDATVAGNGAVTFANVNGNVGTFGDATHVAQITVNGKGLITGVTNVAVTGGGGTTLAIGELITSANAGYNLIADASGNLGQEQYLGCARFPALGGDLTGTNGVCTVTVSKVNGVAYPATPSTNTVPVVTASNVVTYEAVPNAALVNSSVTFNGQAVALGATGNVNAGAAAHSVALNQAAGTAITGAAIGTAGRLLIDQGAAADPLFAVMSGDATLASNGALTFQTVNSNVGSFGDASHVGQFTVNAKGLITAASAISITGGSGSGTPPYLTTFVASLGASDTITETTHLQGTNPFPYVYDSTGAAVSTNYHCKTSGGSTVGCADATSNGDIVIGPLLADTYTIAIYGLGGLPTAQRRRTCTIDNDTQSATPLVAAQFSGGCEIPYAATIVEVDVWGGTGIIGGTLSTTGTSSVNIQKYTPNGGATTTLLSGALATASGYACALTATSGTCINGTTSSSSITVSTTALSAGDWIQVSAATPDTAQTWYRTAITYTVN